MRLRLPNWICRIFFRDTGQIVKKRIEEINDIISLCRKFLSTPNKFLIFDTETTGLGTSDIVIQVAIIDMKGTELINTNVSSISQKTISEESTKIHGITNKQLKGAPYFAEIAEEIYTLAKDRTFLIFNAEFDNRMLLQTCIHNKLPTIKIKALCIQKLYSIFLGEWSEYYNDFKKQKLPNATHNAYEDCISVLKIIKGIAKNNYLEMPKEEYKLFGIRLN